MSPFVTVSLVLVALLIALAAHEAGHVFAGRLVGFRFGLLAVGPVCVRRSRYGFSFRWLPPRLWGPFAVAYPVTAENIAARMAWCVAGGPIVSILLAAGGVLLALATSESAIHTFARSLALTSGCLFVATAQPFGTGSGVASDGGRLLALARNEGAARSAAALAVLEGLTESGIRPRDWDSNLVALVSQIETPAVYALSAATALLRHAEDRGDLEEGRRQVEKLRSAYASTPRWLRSDAASEAAFWLAYFQKDVPAAREFLGDVRGPLVDPQRRFRAQAAVSLRTGDRTAASDALSHAFAAIRKGLASASTLELEQLQAIRRDLD